MTAISAANGGVPMLVVTVLVLLVGVGSVTPGGGVMVTVFVTGPVAGAVPRIVMMTLPPDGKRGIEPLTLLAVTARVMAAQALVPVPDEPVHVAVTPVRPAGSVSLKVAPSAALRPLLIRVTV